MCVFCVSLISVLLLLLLLLLLLVVVAVETLSPSVTTQGVGLGVCKFCLCVNRMRSIISCAPYLELSFSSPTCHNTACSRDGSDGGGGSVLAAIYTPGDLTQSSIIFSNISVAGDSVTGSPIH